MHIRIFCRNFPSTKDCRRLDHRIIESLMLEKVSNILGSNLDYHLVKQTMALSETSSWFLSTSRDRGAGRPRGDPSTWESHQHQAQRNNHFPGPAGHAVFLTQARMPFGHLETLAACVQTSVNQPPQAFSHWVNFSRSSPSLEHCGGYCGPSVGSSTWPC